MQGLQMKTKFTYIASRLSRATLKSRWPSLRTVSYKNLRGASLVMVVATLTGNRG